MTPDQQDLFDKLTQLQQRVATGVLAGMTQIAAYFNAGGSAKSDSSAAATASEILTNPNVKAFMDAMKKQAVSNAMMEREEAIRILSALGRGRLTDIVKFRTACVGKDPITGEDAHQTVWTIDEDLQENDPDKLIIISELEVGKFGPKIKQHSKIGAIQLLAKMQGWEAAQKVDATVTVKPTADMSPQEAARAYQDLMGATAPAKDA